MTSNIRPELLGQFIVISKQLENVNDDIPEMIQHFVCVPKIPTPNPNDIPLLLRTKEDPTMEAAEASLIANGSRSTQPWESLKKEIETHNDFCDAIEDSYKMQSEEILKEMKINKYAVKGSLKSKLNSSYNFIESGSYI